MPPRRNKTRCLLALITALVLTWSGPVWAQSKELLKLWQTCNDLEKKTSYQKAIICRKKMTQKAMDEFGLESQQYVVALKKVADLYQILGEYENSQNYFLLDLNIRKKIFNNDEGKIAPAFNNIANIFHNLGLYNKAINYYKKSISIYKNIGDTKNENLSITLNNLAQVFISKADYISAFEYIREAISLNEKIYGGEKNENLANILSTYSQIYAGQKLYEDAIRLLEKSRNTLKNLNLNTTEGYSAVIDNLATIYAEQGNFHKAEKFYQESLNFGKYKFGNMHPTVAITMTNLASLYFRMGRYPQARVRHEHALTIFKKTLGPEHPYVALSLNHLASLYQAQGRYVEAEPLYKRALAIDKKALGPEHPDAATSLNNLAGLYRDLGRYPDSLELARHGTAILRKRFTAQGMPESKGLLSEQRGEKGSFMSHIDLALHPEQVGSRGELTGEAFEVMQLARTSAAGGAIARMAARFAAGSDQVASMVRQQQDALRYYQSLDQKLIKAVSAPPETRNNELEKNLRERISSLKMKLTSLDKEIATQFPEYTNLMSREPMLAAELQELLGKDEALLTFIRSWKDKGKSDYTHVFVVRSDGLRAYTVPVSLEEIKDAVAELRAGLDLSDIERLSDLPSFDTTLAFELYEKLFKPAEEMLQGVKHLFVVPTGPLQSLPLGVLVTKRPGTSILGDGNEDGSLKKRGLETVPAEGVKKDKELEKPTTRFQHYRDVPWLAKKYAITTLPSASSLKALRVFAARTEANKPFIGFGDPVLEGPSGGGKGIKIASLFRGAIADVEEVRKLSRLPDTADELRAMARYLGADASSIYLGKDATETKVKEINLKSARVIAFSTHGLISGDIKHLAEPALVLTPPDIATEADDGLLTASEIAQLKLNAEWVILSACNTAHAESAGAEGLSGLAKAFFYAGSRALLVSHWPVESQSATELTRGMFEALKTNPTMGRSEALRHSMFRLAANDNHPHWAHPAFWAPFVVVGEGARR